MYKTLSLFSGAATPNEEGRQIINSEIHNPQCPLKEDICEKHFYSPRNDCFPFAKKSCLSLFTEYSRHYV